MLLLFPIGPFTDINSEEMEEEIGGMYRTVLKLTKTFGDAPGPRRVADSVKTKIDKFKVHIPLLQIICNPGLRDRHWEQVIKHSGVFRVFIAERKKKERINVGRSI